MIHFNLFQIPQTTARAKGFGIPAKGLSGLGYEGHRLWNTEIHLLPFLVYTPPHVARSLLERRSWQMDAVRRHAHEVGQRGALFLWRTIDGEEASAYCAASTAPYHVDADVTLAARRYSRLSGDVALPVWIQSIVAAAVGYCDKSCRYFADASAMDLGDVRGNVRDGLHVAALGGNWMALVHGFAGLRDHGGRPRFRPALPRGWRRLRFRLRVLGSFPEVDLERERATYKLLEGGALESEHEGELRRREPGAGPRSIPSTLAAEAGS